MPFAPCPLLIFPDIHQNPPILRQVVVEAVGKYLDPAQAQAVEGHQLPAAAGCVVVKFFTFEVAEGGVAVNRQCRHRRIYCNTQRQFVVGKELFPGQFSEADAGLSQVQVLAILAAL